MLPRPHQEEGAAWALLTIRKYGLAYLGWQERTGKTLTALQTVELSKAKTCLIITKKRAIEGWDETLSEDLPNHYKEESDRGVGRNLRSVDSRYSFRGDKLRVYPQGDEEL